MITTRRKLFTLAFALMMLSLAGWAKPYTWPATQAVEGLETRSFQANLDQNRFSGWTMLWSSALESPVIAYGPPVQIGFATSADEILNSLTAAQMTTNDFELVKTSVVLGKTLHYFREMHNGIPVLSGRADIALDSYGRLTRWGLRSYSMWPEASAHKLTLETAAQQLRSRLEAADWTIDRSRSNAVWFPDFDSHKLIPAYWIRLAGVKPSQRWEGIVNAADGEVMFSWSGIQTDVVSGSVSSPYWQPYEDSPSQIGADKLETVIVNGDSITTDMDGLFAQEAGNAADIQTILRGPFVDVTNEDAPRGLLTRTETTPFSPVAMEWSTQLASPPELNLFHHVVFIHQWYKGLDSAYSALDYPMPAMANFGDNYDNAFWNGEGIYFGSGSTYSNFAMSSDVIYHEYTHGVTDGIYPNNMLPYVDQSGAMNEAWSDYIACSINGDPLMGEHLMINSPHSSFRDLENTLVFPANWQGEVHGDSRFISAPLWRIRANLGAGVADSLAHYARYRLAETFMDYFIAVLETDDNDGDLTNGTPHSPIIYESFGLHGIGPGIQPHFALHGLNYYANNQGGSHGNGNRFIEAGETMELVFTLANEAILNPPPATNVQIAITSTDPTVTILNGTQQLASMPAGDSIAVTPILIQVSASAPDHWSSVAITITANNGAAVFDKTIDFSVGLPKLLVVCDDPVNDVERFVISSLQDAHCIFDSVSLAAGQCVSTSYFPASGTLLWLSGDAEGEILTAQDQTAIQNYISAGNKVILSGQNIADSLNNSAFANNLLQTRIESDSLRSNSVTASSAPLTPGEWILLAGSDGAANQREQSSLFPFGTTRSICYYGRNTEGPSAGVEFANGHGLLFGFGLEAISGMGNGDTDRDAFLHELLVWAGIQMEEISENNRHLTPAEFTLGPIYPNPFNATTSIHYSLPSTAGAELRIIDVLGRVVETRSLNELSGEIHWTPELASGIYFAQLSWQGGHSATAKLVLLK